MRLYFLRSKHFIVVLLFFIFSGLMLADKATFRVLFNHDLLYMGRQSPWNPDRTHPIPVEQMLRCSVDEVAAAGCDVITFAPGYGYVPFWKSDIYPYSEHIQWWNQTFVKTPHYFSQYMLDGGDMVEVFVDQCRKKNISPFITIRVNDLHILEFMPLPDGSTIPTSWADLMLDQWRRQHTQYCITRPEERTDLGPDPLETLKLPGMIHKIRREYIMNWIHPEVRDRVYNFIEEVCTKYDIDGLELDFMRENTLFRSDETTSEQRKTIVSAFIIRVRTLLNVTSKPGQYRWLLVRIPAFTDTNDALGIDIKQMADNGVDMFTLSHYYPAYQQNDMAKVTALVPDKAVYLEMTHTTKTGALLPGISGVAPFRRTTDEQFYTSANLAYLRGAQGVSLFNFGYYRETYPPLGPNSEPPFHIIPNIANPEILIRMPQHYILYSGWSYYISRLIPLPMRISRLIPKQLSVSEECLLGLDMDYPKLGKPCEGIAILRVQAGKLWGDREVVVCVNGKNQNTYSDTSEPFINPYPSLLGAPGTLKAWAIPLCDLRIGFNTIKLNMIKGEPMTIDFVDIAIKYPRAEFW